MNDEIREIFNLLRSSQKDISTIEGKLNSHLESSEVRVKYYDEQFDLAKKDREDTRAFRSEMRSFRDELKGQKNGIDNLIKYGGYIFALLSSLLVWILKK